MSQTTNIGVHERGYYRFMATVMEEKLTSVFINREIKYDSFPPGILTDAQVFFASVLESTREKVPQNPLASINDYLIAREIVKGMNGSEECNKTLKEFGDFVASLGKSRHLVGQEIQIARHLLHFFELFATE